jgi:hypothetical protein
VGMGYKGKLDSSQNGKPKLPKAIFNDFCSKVVIVRMIFISDEKYKMKHCKLN